MSFIEIDQNDLLPAEGWEVVVVYLSTDEVEVHPMVGWAWVDMGNPGYQPCIWSGGALRAVQGDNVQDVRPRS